MCTHDVIAHSHHYSNKPDAAPQSYPSIQDYEKVFYADVDNDVFELREIDRTNGCMLVVRPDLHVADVLPLTAHAELAAFFDRFMLENPQ